MITIDGAEWNVPCDLERTADITPSEISGMMLDKTYFNDVLGTFLTYDVRLAVPPTMESEYFQIYEALTDPVESHQFVLPYNGETIELTARVERVRDVYVLLTSRKQLWKGVEFTVIANHPTKRMNYGEIVTIGRSTVPDMPEGVAGQVCIYDGSGWQEVNLEQGKLYEYTGTGFTESEITDADDTEY